MRKMLAILFFVLLTLGLLLPGCYSCESYHKWKGTGQAPKELENKFFWSTDCKAWAALQQKPAPAPAPAPVARPAPIPLKPVSQSDCGPYTLTRDYPSQNVVRLEKDMPAEVQLNAPFVYTIKVTNLTDMMLADVVVKESLSDNYKFENASLIAEKADNKLIWTIVSLGPKDSVVIKINGSATKIGCIQNCATVSYVIPACANVKVVEAKLSLKKTAPAEVLVCDLIPVQYVVTNAGSGIAQNVKIIDELPVGLKTDGGQSQVMFDAGTLGPGQSKQFSAQLKASKTGKYVNRAVATSASGLKTEATATTIVSQPILEITKVGRKQQYLNQVLTYDITVTNKGDGVAKNTIVQDTIPEGVTRISASQDGKVTGSKVVWELGTLAVNASRKVSVSYTPVKIGDLKDTATASAYCADAKTASVTTSVIGIPAILLEVIDIEDPVQVGNTTTYVVVATNQGSMPGTNIVITATWEDSQAYVSSGGATTGSVTGNTVTFAPLRSLAPGAKATWQVVVKAIKADDVRFTVVMKTSDFERPIQETESTNLYE
ncbi:MAG: hypothetical protein A2167_07460 [Planctomycetes bacterium RBG_13_46_10]|nr:MAG: hypothetical protein A2167_07460 [Planctomycetes bacterium RBG_13_46_10]